jgi:hypothetical protein
MMRAASKILDDSTPEPVPRKEDKGPQYAQQRCKTIDPNFRQAPFNRARSPREARKRRQEGWTDCRFSLPRLTVEGLRMVSISLAEEQQHSGWPKEARRYPKTRNYYVAAALNDLFRKLGFEQYCVQEQQGEAHRVRRFVAPSA